MPDVGARGRVWNRPLTTRAAGVRQATGAGAQCVHREGLGTPSGLAGRRRMAHRTDGDPARGLDSCVVVEIPPGDDDPTFVETHAAFERLPGSQVKSRGTPIRWNRSR